MAEKHQFSITVAGQVVCVTGGEDRKEVLRRALEYAGEYAEAGFQDLAVLGATPEDWASTEAVSGWPKGSVH
jgi:hypothetical protein